jgi:hypothetical protein
MLCVKTVLTSWDVSVNKTDKDVWGEGGRKEEREEGRKEGRTESRTSKLGVLMTITGQDILFGRVSFEQRLGGLEGGKNAAPEEECPKPTKTKRPGVRASLTCSRSSVEGGSTAGGK